MNVYNNHVVYVALWNDLSHPTYSLLGGMVVWDVLILNAKWGWEQMRTPSLIYPMKGKRNGFIKVHHSRNDRNNNQSNTFSGGSRWQPAQPSSSLYARHEGLNLKLDQFHKDIILSEKRLSGSTKKTPFYTGSRLVEYLPTIYEGDE